MWVSKTKAAILKFRQFIWIKPNKENLLTRLKTLWNKKREKFPMKTFALSGVLSHIPFFILRHNEHIFLLHEKTESIHTHIYFQDRKTVDLIFFFPNISSRIIDENMLYVFSELRLKWRRRPTQIIFLSLFFDHNFSGKKMS
jgi:hypothetical protein